MTLACRIRRRQRRDERRAASTERAPWGERRSGRRGHRGRARRAPARRREARAPKPPPPAALAGCARFRGGVPGGRRRGATICRSSRMRRRKRRGPELFLSAAIKQSWAAPRGTKGPKARGASRGRHIEPAGRAPPARASCARGRAYRDFRAPPKALVPGNSTSKRKAPQKGRRRWWEGSVSVGFPPP